MVLSWKTAVVREISLKRLAYGVVFAQICGFILLVRSTRYEAAEPDLGLPSPYRQRALSEYRPESNLPGQDIDIDYPFSNYDLTTPPDFTLTDSSPEEYFTNFGGDVVCFTEGTDRGGTKRAVRRTKPATKKTRCVCKQDYYGDDCGIPAPAWFGYFRHKYPDTGLVRRSVPRRLIQAINVNHELEMFEARLEETYLATDVYVLGESNHTALGEEKNLTFLQHLESGWLRHYQGKIMYMFQDHFPDQGSWNGWYSDTYMRKYLGEMALKRLRGIRDSDLFFIFDADELPNREVLVFLKLYDGYGDPVELGLKWNVYGFFWKKADPASMWGQRGDERMYRIKVGCTVGMLREVYGNNSMLVRSPESVDLDVLEERYSRYGGGLGKLSIGAADHYAGFHCSWCYPPAGIRTKLVSAQRHDKPRWGDFPEKLKLDYISGLIRNGEWFDGTRTFIPEKSRDKNYAPEFFLENQDRFRYLLVKPK